MSCFDQLGSPDMIVFECAARIPVWLLYLISLPFLVVTARTWDGRRLGFLALFIVAAAMNWTLFVNIVMNSFVPGGAPRHPIWNHLAIASFIGVGICLVCAFVFAFGVLFLTRPYQSTPDSRLSSTFLGPVWAQSWQMSLTPEADLLANWTEILSRLLWVINRNDARQLRETMRELLDDMSHDPSYTSLAPALPLTLFGAPWRVDTGHHYSYVPLHTNAERLGLIVVFHGNGPNFAIMLHVWRAFADQHRCVIVCPTYGVGFYLSDRIVDAFARHREYALRCWPIDADRVYVAGLSDGGVGAARVALALPDQLRGLILLSPTIQAGLAERWRKPTFVLQGQRDWNVSPKRSTACVEQLRAAGVAVEYCSIDDADHFVWFSQRDEVQQRLGEWLRMT
jgi:pimeloyl-ACP methyl ester carboxylesterase